MVKEEEDRVKRFQQGMSLDILNNLASQELRTYNKVLTTSCRVGIIVDKDNRNK